MTSEKKDRSIRFLKKIEKRKKQQAYRGLVGRMLLTFAVRIKKEEKNLQKEKCKI